MSNDLIKRSDAIKVIWGEDINPSEDGMVFEAQSHIDRDIRLIPSEDRPQGEWIVSDKDSVCSVCGKDEVEFVCGTEDWYGYGLSNYCPNCGAKMKGAEDERG